MTPMTSRQPSDKDRVRALALLAGLQGDDLESARIMADRVDVAETLADSFAGFSLGEIDRAIAFLATLRTLLAEWRET